MTDMTRAEDKDMADEMILVPRAELLAWAKAWQDDYGPNDGTDCVTPFDTYLLKTPVEAQPVAWQYQDRNGKWHGFTDESHRLNTIEDGSWPVRALYDHPPPSAPVGVGVLQAAMNELRPPEKMTEARAEYWKAGARAAIRAMNEALAQQPAAGVGEEIMVNAAHDVYTLPLQPSGLSSGPRFVVHVPAPEREQPAADQDCDNCGGFGDVSGEYPGDACPDCRGTGKVPAQQPAAVDGEDFDCLHSAFDNCDCYADQQGGSDDDR